MNFYKWLTVIGGVLTLGGLLTAFMSRQVHEQRYGESTKGDSHLGASSGQPETERKGSFTLVV